MVGEDNLGVVFYQIGIQDGTIVGYVKRLASDPVELHDGSVGKLSSQGSET